MKLINKRLTATIAALLLTASSVCHVAMAEELSEVNEAVEMVENIENAAEETLPKVEFVLSEPDEEGYLTASLMIYNASFSGAQFGFSFDNTVLQLVDKETKEATEEFDKAATLYNFETEKGTHTFTPLSKLSVASNEEGKLRFAVYGMKSSVSDDGAAITVDEDGYKLYGFSFKLLKNENPSFEVLDYGSVVYPKEAILAKGGENLEINFSFIMPESMGVEEEVLNFAPIPPEPSLEVKRKERLVDSLILNIGNYAAVDDGYLKWIDDNNKNVVPFIEGDRTYVPLRFIGEAFGAEVDWNSEIQEITINLGETVIKMNIGKTVYTVNGEEKEMDVAPFIKDDRTIVPIRFVSEALDKAVYWDSGMKLVIVTPADRPWDSGGEAEKDILPDALLIISELVRDIKVEVPEQTE